MRRGAIKLFVLLALAGCQSASVSTQDNSGTGADKSTPASNQVTSLADYTGTWQVDSLAGGSTQIDIKPVGGRYLGYADRYITGKTVAMVETRLENGRIKMDWDVDARVEMAPDITTTCDVVEEGRVLNCTGWPLQGRKRWHKVSDDYLVEARTGKTIGAPANRNASAGNSSGGVSLGSERDAVKIAGLVRGSSCGYKAGPDAARIYANAAGAVRQVRSDIPAALSQAVAKSKMGAFSCSLAHDVIEDRLRVARGSIETFRKSSVIGAPLRLECKQAFDPSIVGAAECQLAATVTELVVTAELCRRHCS